jgi:hypothetical protein
MSHITARNKSKVLKGTRLTIIRHENDEIEFKLNRIVITSEMAMAYIKAVRAKISDEGYKNLLSYFPDAPQHPSFDPSQSLWYRISSHSYEIGLIMGKYVSKMENSTDQFVAALIAKIASAFSKMKFDKQYLLGSLFGRLEEYISDIKEEPAAHSVVKDVEAFIAEIKQVIFPEETEDPTEEERKSEETEKAI